ncbi:MAG TPA: hypothetical protein VF478_00810, partial [Anaerolineae bacterium]
MKHPKPIVPIVLLLVVVVGGYLLYSNGLLPFAVSGESNTVSGFIEGEEIQIAPEVGGRIESIAVDEG